MLVLAFEVSSASPVLRDSRLMDGDVDEHGISGERVGSRFLT